MLPSAMILTNRDDSPLLAIVSGATSTISHDTKGGASTTSMRCSGLPLFDQINTSSLGGALGSFTRSIATAGDQPMSLSIDPVTLIGIRVNLVPSCAVAETNIGNENAPTPSRGQACSSNVEKLSRRLCVISDSLASLGSQSNARCSIRGSVAITNRTVGCDSPRRIG
jgi:hypothetical protein